MPQGGQVYSQCSVAPPMWIWFDLY